MLMALFLESLQREVNELHENNVRLQIVGARERLSIALVEKIRAGEELTANNTGLHLVVAVAYGGRWDIVEASRALAVQAASGTLDPSDIDEHVFADHLALAGIPDPDLLIRTGGERRISNFLLWNLAYAELCFSDTLWPDFRKRHLDEALDFYASRQRRYGNTPEQLEAVKC